MQRGNHNSAGFQISARSSVLTCVEIPIRIKTECLSQKAVTVGVAGPGLRVADGSSEVAFGRNLSGSIGNDGRAFGDQIFRVSASLIGEDVLFVGFFILVSLNLNVWKTGVHLRMYFE